jgi:hypothetical protein
MSESSIAADKIYGSKILNTDLINKLSIYAENACKSPNNSFGYGIWSHHIKPMIQIGIELATDYHADEEVVVIAILLHDLAAIKDGSKRKDHHIFGAEEAQTYLTKENYPPEKIDLVKKCILNHRGSINNFKGTIEEICVADADAVAHIQEIGSLFYVAYKEMDMSIDDGIEWIKGKIQRDWNKMSENGKNRFKRRYDEIMRILG